ncbi:MAG: hypothetical protein ACR2NZ_12820, partial [Rubripirellula sp.]
MLKATLGDMLYAIAQFSLNVIRRISAFFRRWAVATDPHQTASNYMSSDSKIEISTELLRRLHRIHRQRTDLKSQIARGPRQIKAGEGLVAKANADVDAAKAALKKATMGSDEKQLQLKSREAHIEELKAKLNTAASNREFSTLKEQIAADEQANSVQSDEILEALESIDTLDAELKVMEAELGKQQSEHES